MSKILWISDFDLRDRPAGGAEITNDFMIQEGRKRGHEINIAIHNEYNFIKSKVRQHDLVILNNIDFFEKNHLIELTRKKFIWFLHDTLGNYRVYRKMKFIYDNALIRIFLSPLHAYFFNRLNPKPYYCVPPHIPESFFKLSFTKRKRAVLYAGNLWNGIKNVNEIYEIAKANPHIEFHFYYHRFKDSTLQAGKKIKNCKFFGYIEKEKIPELFKQYEYFIHIPSGIEAFGRSIGEAFASRCKIITNENVGAFSYPCKDNYNEFKKMVLNSPNLFWDIIEKYL